MTVLPMHLQSIKAKNLGNVMAVQGSVKTLMLQPPSVSDAQILLPETTTSFMIRWFLPKVNYYWL